MVYSKNYMLFESIYLATWNIDLSLISGFRNLRFYIKNKHYWVTAVTEFLA